MAARDNHQAGVELARGQRDEDIGGIIRQAGAEASGALDAGLPQHVVAGGVVDDVVEAALGEPIHHLRLVVDHHEVEPLFLQPLGHLLAHAPVAADDVVSIQTVDLSLHASSPQNAAQLARDNVIRHRAKNIGQRAHAQQNQQGRKNPALFTQRAHLAKAHRAQRDHRHVERGPPRPALDQPVAQRTHGNQAAAQQRDNRQPPRQIKFAWHCTAFVCL